MGAHLVRSADIDLSDNATFAQGFPHDHFTWAREHAPVYWHEPTAVTPDGEGFWVMSRHEDAMAVMLDPATFSSDKGGGRTAGGTGLHDEYQAGKFLNWTDDPRHKRLRSLVNKGFTNRAIHELETELRRRTVALIEALPENEPFDFVARFSRDLPLQAICLLLGVPQEDRAQLAEWVDAGVAAPTPEIIAREYAWRLRDYGARLIAEKRKNLDRRHHVDDHQGAARARGGWQRGRTAHGRRAAQFLHAAVSRRRRDDAQRHRRRLARADGSSGAARAAAHGRHRRDAHRHRRDPALDHALDPQAPHGNARRELQGHRIKAGDKVTYWEMSANRDAAVFDDPFRFDIARSPNRHVAFGFGAHVCLGASLARMEMRLAFAELLARIETFTPEGPIDWMPSNRLLGIRHMPLSIRFRSPSVRLPPSDPQSIW